MSNLWILIKKDFLELRRSRKLLVLMVLFLFIAVASPLTAKLMPQILKSVSTPGLVISLPEPSAKDAVDQFVKNLTQTGVIVVIFVVAGSVADERRRKSLEVMLTKPVSRSLFIASKFLTYLGVMMGGLLASFVIFYAYTGSLLPGLSLGRFAMVAGLLLLYVLMVSAVTLAGSTVQRSPLAAAGVGFLFFVALSLVSSLSSRVAPYLPDRVLSQYESVLAGGWDGRLWWPVGVSLAVVVGAVWWAVYRFRREEIER